MKRATAKRSKRRDLKPADYVGCAVRLVKKIRVQASVYEAGTVMVVTSAGAWSCTLNRQIDRVDCFTAEPKEFTPLEPGICHACQCTDEWGCDVGCEWMDETHTLCSACVAIAEAVTGLDLVKRMKPR